MKLTASLLVVLICNGVCLVPALGHGGVARNYPPIPAPTNPTPVPATGPERAPGTGVTPMPKPAATGPATPTMGSAPTGGTGTGALALGPDLTTWEIWWGFNKDPFLNLKAAVHAPGLTTGSERDLGLRGMKPTADQIQKQVIPALLAVLKTEESRDILTGALMALAKLGSDSEVTGVLRRFLAHNNQEVSETAALALGIQGEPAAAELLSQILADSKTGRQLIQKSRVPLRTRAFAAYALGLLGRELPSEGAKISLQRNLSKILLSSRSASKDLHVACISALGILWDPARDEDLGYSQAATAVLEKVLEDPKISPLTRAHSPTAMARISGPHHPYAPEISRRFLGLLKQKNTGPLIRQACVLALGGLVRPGGPHFEAAMESLSGITRRAPQQVERNFALIALGRIGGAEAQAALLRFLNEKRGRPTMRPWAAMGLAVLGSDASGRGELPDASIGNSLLAAFRREKNPSFQSAYALALGILRFFPAKSEILEEMNKGSHWALRGYCGLALGMMGAKDAGSDLKSVLDQASRRPEILKHVATGLALLGDKRTVMELVAMLEESKSLYTQASLCAALGLIGDRRTIQPLLQLLQNTKVTNLGRAFAAAALGLICDRDPLPWNSILAQDVNYLATVSTLNEPFLGTGVLNLL